jgi:hypothetical protein
VHKPGPRPTALAFSKSRPGQKLSQAKGQARLFLARLGPASGLRPELAHHYYLPQGDEEIASFLSILKGRDHLNSPKTYIKCLEHGY